jgi:hypothetical protein
MAAAGPKCPFPNENVRRRTNDDVQCDTSTSESKALAAEFVRTSGFWDSRSCSLLLFGTTYQQIGERHDRRLAPQLGRSIEVAGRTLNIYCSGEGRRAVLLAHEIRARSVICAS